MERLTEIRDLDDLVFELYGNYSLDIMDSEFSKKFPNTFHISNLLTVSTNFIKNSIFDCLENDDLFGAKILFRSLIEHFLRFQYVSNNWMEFKDDNQSKMYLDYTKARLMLDQIKSTVAEHKLHDPDYKVVSWQEILDEIPGLKKYSKKEIEQETLKYTYKNIIKSLKEIDRNSEDSTLFLASLIAEYSKLSSFVHGGAGAFNEMFTYENHKKRKEEYIRIAGLTFQMANTVKLFSLLMIIQTDKMYDKFYQKVNTLINKVSELGN